MIARVLLAAVRGYQRVSAHTAPRCRFAPTCSAYALEALELHGVVRGGGLALARVTRCHPFHPGGIDHVPAAQGGADARLRGRPASPVAQGKESLS